MLGLQPDQLAVLALTMVISLTMHELAHARTALAFGDPTARSMGRVSLNPLVHLDPIGTISFLLAGFGWAKPVPVNPANLQPPRLGNIAVSLAGPLANLGLAVLAGLTMRFMLKFPELLNGWLNGWLWLFMLCMLTSNLYLCLFNLIPLYPLDGHHIQRELLPARSHGSYMNWQIRYGRGVLMGIIFVPRLLQVVLEQPDIQSPLSWVYGLVGEPIANFLIGL